MKRVFTIFLCAVMMVTLLLPLITMPALAADSGLLSDFENEVYGGFYWKEDYRGFLGHADSVGSVETEENGNHYLYMPLKSSNYNAYYKGFPVEAGKTYVLRLRYKGTRVGVQIQNCASGGGMMYLPAATEWTEHSIVFTLANPLTTSLNFMFAIWSISTGSGVYVDDVYLNEVVDLEGISLAEGSALTLALGEKKQLNVVAEPAGALLSDAVSYQSSNPKAATVDANGVVTAVSAGIAHITAVSGAYSATCTVTVDQFAPMLLGDFEGTLSPNWTWSNPTYGVINSSSPMKVVKDGDTDNYCLSLPPKENEEKTGYEAYFRNYMDAPVEANKTYTVTFRYKGSGAQLYLLSNGVAAGNGLSTLPAAEKWTTFSKTFTTKTVANQSFSLAFRHTGANTTAYIDDVYLKETTPFDNLLVDGDFEAEALSAQWSQFLTNPKASFVADTLEGGTCLRFDGNCWEVGNTSVSYLSSLTTVTDNTPYKVSFKVRGNGIVLFYMHTSKEVAPIISGIPSDKYKVDGKYVRITVDSDEEWLEGSFIFKNNVAASNYTMAFGGNTAGGVVYVDDLSLCEVGSAYAQVGLVGGAVALSAGDTTDTVLSKLNDGETGSVVTVTVTPNTGYLMVPGSLRYITSSGITKRILNKDAGGFGEGDGNTFAFEAPAENVKVMADFMSTDNTNFAFGTVGTAVHLNADGKADGIRFLNRVQMVNFDPTTETFTLNYNGDEYTVAEIGLLLKRSDVLYPLDVETYSQVMHDNAAGAVKMWQITTYDSQNSVFRAVDYTGSYIDFSISMLTSKPSEVFCDRLYTARSYVILEKDGARTVLYGNERTDSVDTTLQRAEGKLSDDVVVDTDNIESDPSAPIPEDDLDNADLKILNIGNSFGHNSTSYIADIAALEGKTVKVVNLFKSGATLQQHYDGYKNNQAQYMYEINGTVNWNTYVTLKAAIASDDWDIVTMNSTAITSESGYQPYLDKMVDIVKNYCPKAKFYLMQTWAYGDDYAYLNNDTGLTRKEMWNKMLPLSLSVADEADVSLIPCGQAMNDMEDWFEANAPELSVYQADDSHAQESWGWYLLALVWYRTLTGEVPGNTFANFAKPYEDNATVRAAVHEIAMAAVDAYYPQG